MTCRDAEQCILTERDGALTDEQRVALATHVNQCAACQQLRQNLSIALDGWRAETHTRVVPDIDREWHKVRREIRNAHPSRSLRTLTGWIAVPLAAAAAVAIGLYVAPADRSSPAIPAARSLAAQPSAIPAAVPASTVIFVDDSSGWTFVLAPEATSRSQHI